MTEQLSLHAKTDKLDIRPTSLISLFAVFIAFAILAIFLCPTVPAFRDFIDLPLNDNAFDYVYTDFGTLLSDSFTNSAKQLSVMIAVFLCAFSLFCEVVIPSLAAINGFCCGSMLFLSLTRSFDTYCVPIHMLFYVLSCALVLLFSSFCISAHRTLFFAKQNKLIYTVLILTSKFLSIGGAVCLLNITELILF